MMGEKSRREKVDVDQKEHLRGAWVDVDMDMHAASRLCDVHGTAISRKQTE